MGAGAVMMDQCDWFDAKHHDHDGPIAAAVLCVFYVKGYGSPLRQLDTRSCVVDAGC